MDELPDLSSLSHEEKDGLIRMLFPLIEKVRQLTVRVEELEARLSKDSHNSSKPPSSDGLSKKTRSLRVASGKKPGGQAGRTGKTLERAQHVDVVIDHSLAVHLSAGQMLPLGRSAQLITQLFGLTVSPATVLAWIDQASGLLHPEVARIAQALIAAPVAHADESGLRVASRLHWLHTVASDTHTWYGVHAKRGMLAITAHGILPKRMATLVHDCWKPYWQLDCEHALCNAHLLRELTFLHETTCQRWPKRMIGLLLAARDRCEAARADERTALSARQIRRIFTDYDAILVKAQASHPKAARHRKHRGRVKQTPAFNLLRRLREHATEVLRFVTDLRVPFTNNLGERAIRMPKVKQKISGCFRTLKGAQNFCTIRSYLDTMHKQGHNLFEVLRHTFIGCPPSPASV